MRIAMVTPYDLDTPGGVQSHVRHLSWQLREDGDEVTVITPGDPDASTAEIRRVGRVVRVPFNDSVAPIAAWPTAARRTVAALRDLRPDVVHVHEPAVPWVSLAAVMGSPAPTVGTFHAWSDRDRAYRAARPLIRRAVDRLDARIAVSAPAVAYHAGALGVPAGSFRECPNGVAVAQFTGAEPLPELTEAGVPTLLFVGRLEKRKGVEPLIHAFIQLKTKRPSVRLLVIGDGPERDRVQALLPARLRTDVVFLGRVDQGDLPRFHASADVFVAPALGGESFGIVLLEAMAAGLPVVASDIPGYASVLRDGVQGRLVPPGDSAALASALDVLLDNASLRRAMSDEGREHAARFDWSRVAERVRTVYAEAVEAHGSA